MTEKEDGLAVSTNEMAAPEIMPKEVVQSNMPEESKVIERIKWTK